ncbi:class I SAM-dependent methyltransferase [Sulfitobacter sp. HNIBRBA2951]|uniref:class I SAM-dependent methyltransferase n=1 Tax=Sulfitobacter aquimarinus TaxID=3158557 RepID=UPI0032DE9632
MTSGEENAPSVYEMQHEVWPGWADGDFGAEEDAAQILDLVERSTPGRALDLGCGSGRLSCAMAKLGWRIDGVDISTHLIDRARRRAERHGVAGTTSFEVADLRQFIPQEPYELVILWDSVLAIWPWGDARQTLGKICEKSVSSGGHLVIGQLNPAYFSKRPDFKVAFENPAIGPGKSRRHYQYDTETGVLCDDVSVSHDGVVSRLPTQCLFLVPPSDIEGTLCGLNFAVHASIGSADWVWPDQRRAADQDAAQFILVGRKT